MLLHSLYANGFYNSVFPCVSCMKIWDASVRCACIVNCSLFGPLFLLHSSTGTYGIALGFIRFEVGKKTELQICSNCVSHKYVPTCVHTHTYFWVYRLECTWDCNIYVFMFSHYIYFKNNSLLYSGVYYMGGTWISSFKFDQMVDLYFYSCSSLSAFSEQ